MPKMRFFLKKGMKEMSAYVLEFKLTFDKMQITSPSALATITQPSKKLLSRYISAFISDKNLR